MSLFVKAPLLRSARSFWSSSVPQVADRGGRPGDLGDLSGGDFVGVYVYVPVPAEHVLLLCLELERQAPIHAL